MDKKHLPMAICAVLGLGIMVKSGISYGLGSLSAPGPGFFPFTMGFVVLVISSCSMIMNIISRKGTDKEISLSAFQAPREGHLMELLSSIAVMGIYALTLEGVGYMFSSAIMVFVFFYYVGKIRLTNSLLGAIGISLISYLFFGKLLDVQLPKGILPF